MKLATINQAGEALPAFVLEGRVVPLERAYEAAGLDQAPATMLALIERDNADENNLSCAWDAAHSLDGADAAGLEWCPPVRGFKILSTAINNAGIARLATVVPENPPFFLKPSSAMVGHRQPIVIRADYGLTHPEAELAVVIGKRAKHLSHDEALDAVFGYTIINDVSSVDLKSEDTYVFPKPAGQGPPPPGFQWGDNMQLPYHARSKGTDTFAPIGPWIVTWDEIANPNNLAVRAYMDEEEVTTDNTANLRYSVEDVLVWASRYFTLEPGDIVNIGTAAAGKYAIRDLDLQVWDGPLSIEIEGIGRLTNPIDRVDLAGNKIAARAPDPTNVWPPRFDAAR